MATRLRLRPFFAYYGSKWRLAPRYPQPLHGEIVEPFAGSAAYSLLHHERRVVLYDSGPAAAVWRFLIDATESEVLRIPLLGPDQTVDDLAGLPEEARFLVGFWLSKGTAHVNKSPSAWMRSGLYPDQFWGEKIRERIASQLRFIRHWRVGGDDYRQACHGAATWFIDPPYQGRKGRLYYGRSLDYAELGRWCRSLSGQVITCESSGATWLPFERFATTRGTAAGRSEEAVWLQ
jgi:hypothetical protein